MADDVIAPASPPLSQDPGAAPAPAALPSESSTRLSPNVAATLAYLGWWTTGLLFWFLERRDAYVRFHAAQSVAAFGIIAVLIGAFFLLAVASLSFLPRAFGPFLWAAGGTWVAGLLLWVVAM